MQYRMPYYGTGDATVGAFNRQKQYFALYLNPAAVAPHRAALKNAASTAARAASASANPGTSHSRSPKN